MSRDIAADDWRVLTSGTSAWFNAPSQGAGAALVGRIAELTDDPPDVDLRAQGVQVRFPAGADVTTTRAISAAAKEVGLAADPSVLQAVQVRIEALDRESVMPFWHAVLGYDSLGDDGLVDPMRRDPGFSFRGLSEPRPLRNRLHVDVSRPQTLAAGVEAAAAAGGRVAFAGEGYRTLADAEGNEVDIVPDDALAEGAETADWRVVFGGMTFYPTASPTQSAELAAAVAGRVDETGMPLMVDLRPGGVTIDTGKDQWIDERFADLARRTQAAARDLGLRADPTPLRFVQIGIDAVDIPAVRTFWRAVLGYDAPRPEVTDIYHPRWLNPPLFFQQMDSTDEDRRRQRNRIRLELVVPHDQLQARIDVALGNGGRIVQQMEPDRLTLADPENNELDLITTKQ